MQSFFQAAQKVMNYQATWFRISRLEAGNNLEAALAEINKALIKNPGNESLIVRLFELTKKKDGVTDPLRRFQP